MVWPALGPALGQPVVDGLGQLEALAGLAGGDDEAVGRDSRRLQRALHAPSVGVHHIVVGDDVGRALDANVGQPVAQIVEDVPPRDDGVGAAGVVDRGGQVGVGHGVGHCSCSSVAKLNMWLS